MTRNAQVVKNGNENNTSLLRRFTRRVQSSGALGATRRNRYHDRPLSKQMKKKKKIRQLERAEKVRWLVKLGIIPDKRS